MNLSQFFSVDGISLNLEASERDEILKEIIALLKLDTKSEDMLYQMLKRRENLASTGMGRGIAIPHCRSLVMPHLRAAFARSPGGADFNATDEKPVHYFFLIVAPPLEISNDYLPVLGQIAQLVKEPDMPERLSRLETPEQFIELLAAQAK